MRIRVYKSALIVVVLVACLAPAAAQLQMGDNLNLHANGTVSAGYSGAFASLDGSNHGLDLGGTGSFNGFYYNPQFLTFNFQPYYRRSQNNSAYQTITNGSGFTGDVNLFSGSRFPGTVSYGKTWNTTGQFGIPSLPGGVTSHGNGQNFGVTWSALLPKMPTLTASFSDGSGTSTIFGANANSESNSKNLSLQSTYTWAGFHLLGQYTHLSMNGTFPALLGAEDVQNSHTGSNSFNVTAGHALPLHGYWTGGWDRSSYSGVYTSGGAASNNDGSANTLQTAVSFNPTRKLSVGSGFNYNDNAFASLQQQIVSVGGVPILPSQSGSTRTLSFNGQGSYAVFNHLSLYARATHYEVYAPGLPSHGLTQFSGNAAFNFAQRLLGALTFSVGVVDTSTETGHSGTSVVGNVNFQRRIDGWDVGGNFAYTQQVQTLVDVYATSMYSYGATARRRLGQDLYWSNSFNAHHSGLQQFAGFNNHSESITTAFRYRRYSVNGTYSQSSGTSILTPTGLVDLPAGTPPPPLLRQPIFYQGKSYGGGASVAPLRRMVISLSYGKGTSGTAGPSAVTAFNSTMLNSRLVYRLRKLDLEGNYTRFQQNITTGVLPAVLNSYYVRVSRWFDIF